MPQPRPLPYESCRPGPLVPGEVIIWQAHPRRSDGPRITCCVTDRRLMMISEQETQRQSATLDEIHHTLLEVDARGRRRLFATGGGYVSFPHLDDLDTCCRLLVSHIRRSNRAAQQRRTPLPARKANLHMTPDEPASLGRPQLPPLVELTPGERLLWSHEHRRHPPVRKRDVESVLTTLFWLIVPVGAFVLRFTNRGRAFLAVHGVVLVVAAFWILLAGWGLLRRLYRRIKGPDPTWYAVTTLRAIVVKQQGRRRSVSTTFLDLQSTLTLEVEKDGRGQISFHYLDAFHDIPDAVAVHALIVRTIRAAGGRVVEDEDEPV